MALKCAFQVVTALDAWAGPIKDTSERTSDMDEASSSSVPSASAASDKGEGSPLARDGTPGGWRCSWLWGLPAGLPVTPVQLPMSPHVSMGQRASAAEPALDAWHRANVSTVVGSSASAVVCTQSELLPCCLPACLPSGSADSRFTEAERFEAAKAHKAEMTKGVALFNSNPVKGMAALQRSGVAGSTPQQVGRLCLQSLVWSAAPVSTAPSCGRYILPLASAISTNQHSSPVHCTGVALYQ